MSTDPHMFMLILELKYNSFQWQQWKCFSAFLPPAKGENAICKLPRDLLIGRVESPGMLSFSVCSLGLSLLDLTVVQRLSSLVRKQSASFSWSQEAQLNHQWWFYFLLYWRRWETEKALAYSCHLRQAGYAKAFRTKRTSRNGETPRSPA